jgi:hypothetical protein
MRAKTLAAFIVLAGCGGRSLGPNAIEGGATSMGSDASDSATAAIDAQGEAFVGTKDASTSEAGEPCDVEGGWDASSGVAPSSEYADVLCGKRMMCTGDDAAVQSTFSSCVAQVTQSVQGKAPTGCFSACLAFLLQVDGGDACGMFADDNLPLECASAFQVAH